MKKTVNVLCTLALMSALCAGCRGGDVPTPTPDPIPPIGSTSPELPQKQAEEGYYYYYQNERQYFELDTKYAFVEYREPEIPIDIVDRGIAHYKVRHDDTVKDFQYSAILIFEDGLSEKEYLDLLTDINKANPKAIVQPCFESEKKDPFTMWRYFYVELKSVEDADLLEKAAELFDCAVDHQNTFMPRWYVLAITKDSKLTSMEYANIFHESGLFKSAYPGLGDGGNGNDALNQ